MDEKSCGIPLMNNFPQVLINNNFVDILSNLVLTNCVLYNKEGYCGIKSCVTRTITQLTCDQASLIFFVAVERYA